MTIPRPTLRLSLLPGEFSVCRREHSDAMQPWMTAGEHWCIARTPTELSVVCERSFVPVGTRAEHGWRLIRFEGPLPFGLTGILASACDPLAAAEIPVFVFSTFDLDYIMVNASNVERAAAVLRRAGHTVVESPAR